MQSCASARRAGLLHDIGCAAEQEIEGSHAQAVALLARKYGESAKIVHAIECHHGEVAADDVLDHIVDQRLTLVPYSCRHRQGRSPTECAG